MKSCARDVSNWIKDYAEGCGINTLVVGVSGGIDSAVILYLCEMTGLKTISVFMPLGPGEECRLRQKIDDLMKQSTSEHRMVYIRDILLIYQESYVFPDNKKNLGRTELSQGNLRARIRANILYDIAGTENGLVVGTDNKDEEMLGYFTKGGDGLVDILPIVNFHKSEVYELAEELNIPESIINAAPSANLWDGQTDEGELGMTYAEIEVAIKVWEMSITMAEALKIIDSDRFHTVYSKVLNMINKTYHKRNLPPSYVR